MLGDRRGSGTGTLTDFSFMPGILRDKVQWRMEHVDRDGGAVKWRGSIGKYAYIKCIVVTFANRS